MCSRLRVSLSLVCLHHASSNCHGHDLDTGGAMTGGSEGGAGRNDDKADKGGSGGKAGGTDAPWQQRLLLGSHLTVIQCRVRRTGAGGGAGAHNCGTTSRCKHGPTQPKKKSQTLTDRQPTSHAPRRTAKQCPGDKSEKGVHRNGVRALPKHDEGRTGQW